MPPVAWVPILSALLALSGVLLGLWLGQKRWRAEQARSERAQYDENLRSAYLELWEVVSETHARMRSALEGLTAEEFGLLLADVNNFMIRRGLFIERADRHLVLEYLFWLNEYLRRVVTTPEGRAAILVSFVDDEMPASLMQLHHIERSCDITRDRLRTRIRSVVGAPASNGWAPELRASDELKGKLDALTAQVALERESKRHDIMPSPSDDADF